VGRLAVPGAELVYDEQGLGEPLVLVHGTGAQASTWGGAVGDLVAGGYRVIAYDRRGYGRSVHRPVRDYRVHVADLAAVIEHVGAPAYVLGWSSGGSTALALAVERPELCRCVVVVEAIWHGLRYVTGDFLGVYRRIKFAQLCGRRREAAAIFFRWASGLCNGYNGFDALSAVEQEVLLANGRVVLAELDGYPFGQLMEYMSTKKLAASPVPMIWLLGTETRSEWFRKLHSKAVQRAPNIRSDRIVGAGHFAHCDVPKNFAATVLRAVMNTP